MKVADLLLALEGVDPELPVYVYDNDHDVGWSVDQSFKGAISTDLAFFTRAEDLIEEPDETDIEAFIVVGG